MTLTKNHLIDCIQEKAGLSKRVSTQLSPGATIRDT